MLKKRRRGRAGVGLMELMFVTGILSDLAGTSGNAFVKCMDKAHQAQCQNNLKQLYLAIQMKVDENDGRLPMAWFFPNAWVPQDPYSLVNIIAGSDQSIRKLFICPAAPDVWRQAGITYVYNDTIRGMLLDSLPNPAQTWLLMDCNVMSPKFPATHVGGHNVLFCDGHVTWVPQEAISTIWKPPAPTDAQAPAPVSPPADAGDE